MPPLTMVPGISDFVHNSFEQRLVAFICLGSTLCTADTVTFVLSPVPIHFIVVWDYVAKELVK